MPHSYSDQFSPSDSSINAGGDPTRKNSVKLEPGRDLNAHTKPQGSGISHSSDPSNVIETTSATGRLCISGRNANLINVDELSKILAFVDKQNRGLSSKSNEIVSSLIDQLFNSAKAWPDGMLIYLRLWQRSGKAAADRFAEDHRLQPAIDKWLVENWPAY